MGDRLVVRAPVVVLRDGRVVSRRDSLAAEEPMEIRLDGEPVAVTMRTPGHDFELAAGFCLTEGLLAWGLLAGADDVATIRYCAGTDERGHNTYNVVDVQTRSRRPLPPDLRRHVYTTSSCGICGTASLDAVRRQVPDVAGDAVRVAVEVLAGLPARLRAEQSVFERTGGLHAAGLFTADGEVVCVREDVGRHNAVDKVIGWAALDGRLPLRGHVLLVSGRVAFEIVQKALVAGIPVVAAVSAPSSLAVGLAAETGMTMVGFLRDGDMNVYAGGQRLGVEGP